MSAVFLIGGHEDRDGERVILRELAALCTGPLALITAASSDPDRYIPIYRSAFEPLGVEVLELRLSSAAQADDPARLGLLERCGGALITGGAQLRGAGVLHGTRAAQLLRERNADGMVVAGTSAGASLLGECMLGRGANDEGPGELEVVEGLGLVPGVLVDQHFSERGRAPRLFAAIAPRLEFLGLGIGENTAAVVDDGMLRVIGQGTVTVADASEASGERRAGHIAVRDLCVHVLVPGDTFPLSER